MLCIFKGPPGNAVEGLLLEPQPEHSASSADYFHLNGMWFIMESSRLAQQRAPNLWAQDDP